MPTFSLFGITLEINPPHKNVTKDEVNSITSGYSSDGTFETQIKKLINEDDENGPMITNKFLAKLAETSIQSRYEDPVEMDTLLDRGNDWLERQIPKIKVEKDLEDIETDWMLLAGLIFDEEDRQLGR